LSIQDRLRAVRGQESRATFAARFGVHYRSVANYESDRDPPVSYVQAIADRLGVRLEWLITGRGPVRQGEDDVSLLPEKIAYAVSTAIEQYYGASTTSLDARASLLRAVAKYLLSIGVSDKTIPDRRSLVRMVEMTAGLLEVARTKERRR
jgi:transcriptional regulator with XRE-family HTH domain